METIIFNKNHVTVTSEQIPKHSSSIGKYRVAWTTEWETIYPTINQPGGKTARIPRI